MIHAWIFFSFSLPPFKALVLAILSPPRTFYDCPFTVHLSFLYPSRCSPWEELFIIAAHLWFISPGMDANSSLRACFKELRMSVAGPNLCSQTTRSVCRDAPFVFRAKQSSQWGASSSHLNSDSVSWFFFFTHFTALSLSLSLALAVFLFPIQSYYLRGADVLETHSLCFFPCWGDDEASVWSQKSLCGSEIKLEDEDESVGFTFHKLRWCWKGYIQTLMICQYLNNMLLNTKLGVSKLGSGGPLSCGV